MAFNIKGLFIKEDELDSNQQPTSSQQVVTPSESNIQEPIVTHIPIQNAPAQPSGNSTTNSNPKIVEQLWDTVISKNLPGPDYIEFKNTVAGLIDVIPDEASQFKGAFSVLKRSYPELNKDVIINSIDTYVNIVEDERKVGLSECEEKRKINIGDRYDQIEALKGACEDINKQINSLIERKAAMESDISKLTLEVDEAKKSIDIEEQTFIKSVDTVITTLNNDKNKVINMNI